MAEAATQTEAARTAAARAELTRSQAEVFAQRLTAAAVAAQESAAAAEEGRAQATAALTAEASQTNLPPATRARLLAEIRQLQERWNANLFLTPLRAEEGALLDTMRSRMSDDPSEAMGELTDLINRVLPSSDPDPQYENLSGNAERSEAGRVWIRRLSEKMGWPELLRFRDSSSLISRASRYHTARSLVGFLNDHSRISQFSLALRALHTEDRAAAPGQSVARQVAQLQAQSQRAAERVVEARRVLNTAVTAHLAAVNAVNRVAVQSARARRFAAAEAVVSSRDVTPPLTEVRANSREAWGAAEAAARVRENAEHFTQGLTLAATAAQERAAAAEAGRAQATAALTAEASQSDLLPATRARLLAEISEPLDRWIADLFLTPLRAEEGALLDSMRTRMRDDSSEAMGDLTDLINRVLPSSDPDPDYRNRSAVADKSEAGRSWIRRISERMGWPELQSFQGSSSLIDLNSRYLTARRLVAFLNEHSRVLEFSSALRAIHAEDQSAAPGRAVARQVAQLQAQARRASERVIEARNQSNTAAANQAAAESVANGASNVVRRDEQEAARRREYQEREQLQNPAPTPGPPEWWIIESEARRSRDSVRDYNRRYRGFDSP